MAANGWYPDPAGAMGVYRYWDGQHWSAETTTDPRTPPPALAGAAGTSRSPGSAHEDKRATRRSRGIGLLVVAFIIVVVVAIVGGVILFGQRTNTVSGPDQPTSTVSSYDDSSPLPTATPTPPPRLEPDPEPDPD